MQSSDQAVPINGHFFAYSRRCGPSNERKSLFRRCRCVSTERRPVSNFQTQTGWTYLSVLQFNSYFKCCGKYDTSGFDGRAGSESGILTELVATLGLEGKEKKLPNELSGGQQQRTSIGRALMTSPLVVLADEPTGNLDSKNSQEIIQLLKTSNKYNQTLIVITHDENIALQADRIIAIEDGGITRDEVIRG